jgi:uncharacterized membrane protein
LRGGTLYFTQMKKSAARAIVEASFIIFLFYCNLLMGQFTHSGLGRVNGFVWAIREIFTLSNFIIAVAGSVVGYVLVELLRSRLWNRKNSKD